MGSEIEGNEISQVSIEERGQEGESSGPSYFEEFNLYENEHYFYMVGKDEEKKCWRMLKISRSEPSKLVIEEDPIVHSFTGSAEYIKDLHRLTGGHELVTECYGIVGFIRFSGPYYIIFITKRTEIGKICGHSIYAISEYKMIPIPHCTVWSYLDNFDKEDRDKKLLCLVDITKDVFFSYSYPIMHSLQKNLCQEETTDVSDGMFIWNKYLTHQIPHSTLWTVALVHGFFKQEKLSHSGNHFNYTLIARRSCENAGPRYEKRGVNAKGHAANEVEIEQIASRDIHGECPSKVTSSVQTRSSIPLEWSQKYSLLNLKPDILLSEQEGDNSNEATTLHFLNLRQRYGNPILILTLLKTHSKKSREIYLHDKYHKVINGINENLDDEDQLQFLTLDIDAAFQRKGTGVLNDLASHAFHAFKQVGFYSGLERQFSKASFDLSSSRVNSTCACSSGTNCSDWNGTSRHQNGILRTNCLDSLDRTNAAQYVYAFVALVHQLVELNIMGSPEIDFDQPLAHDLMILYEAMGDALAHQYGGSAAQSKIFSKIRGQYKAVTHIVEFRKAIQRHYSNSFIDGDKQTAIVMFLGHIKPEVRESAPLETELVQLHAGRLNTV